jgi:hypothetical protein
MDWDGQVDFVALCPLYSWYLAALISNEMKSNHLGLNIDGFE